jgi:hypothetical protein
MDSQLHIQKKYPTTDVETHKALQPHRLTVQTQQDKASQPEQKAEDWQTQLSRAERFGHNLSQVQVHGHSPIQRQVSINQGKLYLQRSVVDDEQKKDEEASKEQR